MNKLDIKEFPNELSMVNFNFKEACEQVRHQTLDVETAIDPRIEDKIEWPFFSVLIWNNVFEHQKILTHKEFKTEYFSTNSDFIDKQNLTEKEEDALRGRMYRGYGSFVRDCLFSLQLQEELSQFGVEVRFNRALDTKEGIDVLLLHNEQRYGLNLFLKSKRSEAYRAKKEAYRHKKYDDIDMCDLPCPRGGRIQIGDIWMYGITDMNIVRQHLGIPIIERCCSINDNFKGWDIF
jgi:hypothetical protein